MPVKPNAAGPAYTGTAAIMNTLMSTLRATAADARSAMVLSPLSDGALNGYGLSLRHQLPEHERKNAAVLVVIDFDRRIDSYRYRHFIGSATRMPDYQRHFLPGTQRMTDTGDVEHFAAGEAEGLRTGPFLELQRQHAHADEIRAMDALEALRDDCADAEELGAFRGPVAGGAGAVLLSGEHDQRSPLLLIAHRRVVDRHPIA